MQPLLRFRLRRDRASPLGTPLASGTVFGHLCWALRDRDGEPALETWLGRLREEPFAVSDGFPAGTLPRPMLPSPAQPLQPRHALDRKALARLEEAKGQRRRNLVSLDRWRDARVGLDGGRIGPALAPEPAFQTPGGGSVPALREARSPHNVIDRRSNHTLQEAGLWFADEWWAAGAGLEVDLYVRTARPADDVADLLRRVGEHGYGRDASLGRGLFAVQGHEQAGWLDDPPGAGGAPRLVSLSHGTVTPNMRDARWKHAVLYGKLGRAMLAEVGGRPWKLPLLLAQPGATWAADNPGPFGEWLLGVHQDLPGIGHNAYHVAIPYTEAARPGTVPEAAA